MAVFTNNSVDHPKFDHWFPLPLPRLIADPPRAVPAGVGLFKTGTLGDSAAGELSRSPAFAGVAIFFFGLSSSLLADFRLACPPLPASGLGGLGEADSRGVLPMREISEDCRLGLFATGEGERAIRRRLLCVFEVWIGGGEADEEEESVRTGWGCFACGEPGFDFLGLLTWRTQRGMGEHGVSDAAWMTSQLHTLLWFTSSSEPSVAELSSASGDRKAAALPFSFEAELTRSSTDGEALLLPPTESPRGDDRTVASGSSSCCLLLPFAFEL